MTNKSNFGQSSKVKSGVSFNPPIAMTGVFDSDNSTTRNGDEVSYLLFSSRRVIEKTSNGPATSKTSTSSNIKIPTVFMSEIFFSVVDNISKYIIMSPLFFIIELKISMN